MWWCGAAGTWNGADLQLISLISLCNFPPRQASKSISTIQSKSTNQPINKQPTLGFHDTTRIHHALSNPLISASKNKSLSELQSTELSSKRHTPPMPSRRLPSHVVSVKQVHIRTSVIINIVIQRAQHPRRHIPPMTRPRNKPTTETSATNVQSTTQKQPPYRSFATENILTAQLADTADTNLSSCLCMQDAVTYPSRHQTLSWLRCTTPLASVFPGASSKPARAKDTNGFL